MNYPLNYYECLLLLFFIDKNYFGKRKFNNLIIQEIWEVNVFKSKLEGKKNLPWNIYYKYKLSLFYTWHVLEDRISLFLVIFLFFL